MMTMTYVTANSWRELYEADGGRFAVELCRTLRHGRPTIAVNTYYTDGDGQCVERYNPTCKTEGGRYVLDPAWILEDTPENRLAIVDEAERRYRRGEQA